MSKTIANLTLPVVVQEIEKVLGTYTDHPYQKAFSIPELRQKLIVYVLSRTSNNYAVIEEGESVIDQKFVNCCLEQHSEIECLIHQGIHHILEQNSDTVSHQIPEEVDSKYLPSHWFG